jgi:6-phosphogluconolactonase
LPKIFWSPRPGFYPPNLGSAKFVFLDIMAQPLVHKFNSVGDLSKSLSKFVVRISEESAKERGVFFIALSGGSLPQQLAPLTEEPLRSSIEWDKWRVFFADERFLSLENPESNFKVNSDVFLSKVPLQSNQIFAIGDVTKLSLSQAAEDYEHRLISCFDSERGERLNSYPRFDLLLLGMGPDGHTCSLFPGHPLLFSTRIIDFLSDSPKPPPERITFTLPLVKASRNIAFAAAGAAKKELLQQVLEPTEDNNFPSRLSKPKIGELHWFVDSPAAENLTRFHPSPDSTPSSAL